MTTDPLPRAADAERLIEALRRSDAVGPVRIGNVTVTSSQKKRIRCLRPPMARRAVADLGSDRLAFTHGERALQDVTRDRVLAQERDARPALGIIEKGVRRLHLYHIDDVSRDEPFIAPVNGKDFVVVPYTLRNNDIVLIEGRNPSVACR
jgi:hypothetical protein